MPIGRHSSSLVLRLDLGVVDGGKDIGYPVADAGSVVLGTTLDGHLDGIIGIHLQVEPKLKLILLSLQLGVRPHNGLLEVGLVGEDGIGHLSASGDGDGTAGEPGGIVRAELPEEDGVLLTARRGDLVVLAGFGRAFLGTLRHFPLGCLLAKSLGHAQRTCGPSSGRWSKGGG